MRVFIVILNILVYKLFVLIHYIIPLIIYFFGTFNTEKIFEIQLNE